jgi:hypothetical protein
MMFAMRELPHDSDSSAQEALPARKRPLSEVPSLPYYGRSFPFLPWKLSSRLRVSLVFARHLYRKFGPPGFLLFWLQLPFRVFPARRQYREGLELTHISFGRIAEAEWLMLLVIYEDLERREGKVAAYRFAKEAIQDCSRFMMRDFYQAERLAEFEDPFEAFWSYHRAMFRNDPNYPNEMIEEGDRRTMIVHCCRNCEIARLTIPELAPLGCDHDITGYVAIEELTGMEFRRPVTLAKDGEDCRFIFYRKGTAPPGAYENH